MKNIPCKLPDPKIAQPLFGPYNITGQGMVLMLVMLVPIFIPFVHYLNQIPLIWTGVIFLLVAIYTFIPKRNCVKTIYSWCITSFIGFVLGIAFFFYSGISFFYYVFFEQYNTIFYYIVLFYTVLYCIVLGLDIIFFKQKINEYKKIIIQSIKLNHKNQPEFVIEIWGDYMQNNKKLRNSKTPLSIKIATIKMIPVIVIGFIFGHPSITAKILLKYNFDNMVGLIIAFILMTIGIFFLFGLAYELLRLFIVFTLKDDEVLGRK